MSLYDEIFGPHFRVRWRKDFWSDVKLGQTEFRSNPNSPWTKSSEFWLVKASTATPKFRYRSRCCDQCHPGPPYRSGGPLDIWTDWDGRDCRHSSIHYPRPGYTTIRYVGGFGPGILPYGLGEYKLAGTLDQKLENASSVDDSWGDPSAYGASAWSKFKPNRPTADAAVFLAELRDVPRMLKTSAKGFADIWRSMGGARTGLMRPKSVADHFLNTQFGWLPFLNDLRKFYRTWHTLDAKMKRIKRMNGQWEKRGGNVLTENREAVVKESSATSGHTPTLSSYYYPQGATSSGHYQIVVSFQRRIWFEAAFKYYIPEWKFESNAWKAATVANLFGLMPNPSVVWEATPWSWLVDWFTNAGDCISNMSDGWSENLVAKYAYLMSTTHQIGKLISDLILWNGTYHDTWQFEYSRKVRQPASPFGFSVGVGNYSLRQAAILVALGISRL